MRWSPSCQSSPTWQTGTPVCASTSSSVSPVSRSQRLCSERSISGRLNRDRKIEVEITLLQLQKALPQQPLVPVGVLRQSVIRDSKRLQLRFGQVPDLDDWNLRQPELLCRKHPTMPNHNVTEVVDHH